MEQRNHDMRYLQQELFDITKKSLVPFNANGQKYLAYGNVNLSIFTTDRCNASCDFCVAQLRYLHDGVDFIKPAIKDDATYFDRMQECLDAVSVLNPSVSITGGEPSLDSRLPRTLQVLAAHGVRKRTITTNGSGLLTSVAGSTGTVLDRLVEYDLQHLNISRAHYNEEKNQQIMRIANPSFSNKQLADVIHAAQERNIRPRLSCVLLKGNVDTLDEMTTYMDWAASMGVDNVVFRQLMRYDETATKQGRIPTFCSNNNVSLLPIWEQIDEDQRFSYDSQLLGYYYYVEVFKYKGITMVSEMADLNKIEQEKTRTTQKLGVPVIYEMVYHPNGTLCGSWREWKDVILK